MPPMPPMSGAGAAAARPGVGVGEPFAAGCDPGVLALGGVHPASGGLRTGGRGDFGHPAGLSHPLLSLGAVYL